MEVIGITSNRLLLAFIFWISSSPLVAGFAANFHYDIDVEVAFQADEKSHLSALKMLWVYDPKISALLVSEPPEKGQTMSVEVTETAERILTDLAQFNYFVKLLMNDKEIAFNPANSLSASWVDNNRLQLRFELPLNLAITPKGNKFVLAMGDTNGSAFLPFANSESVSFPDAFSFCRSKLIIYGEELTRSAERNKEKYQHGQAQQHMLINCK